ncbi:hypothetical protein OQJ13_08555 [Legionella sp. PATHC035]|uniref:hypothetical protein n=1 Tax=Legionella sp. PATHC035 TaxID=2992040 RepID=UPI002243ECBB|nr:hypothetical protein [Legionella sp. PATHC035]MCW8409019.1 hypothetical protein [Legionella sp. PATHC035]
MMLKQKENSGKPQEKRLIPPGLKRQLSVAYIAPNGQLTSDDPDSYQGQERLQYQDALIRQRPETGYADGIIARREKQWGRFFSPKKEEEQVEYTAPTPP